MRMRVVIVCPATAESNNGNWRTAARWQRLLQPAAQVRIVQHWPDAPSARDELMLALHARKSASAIAAWHARHGARGLGVVLTGTDLYPDIRQDALAMRSLQQAAGLVVLQEQAVQALPPAFRDKARVVFQSCAQRQTLHKTARELRVVVVGHLREEKNPRMLWRAVRAIAPDAGIVSARQATVGAVVSPGVELFRLIRQGRLEWRAEVTAAELGDIRAGAAVRLTAASGQALSGRVRMVGPSVDPQTRQALVYVDLNGPMGSARAGMFARGEIVLGSSSALTVPQGAVVVRDGFSYVFSVGADQRVAQHKVQTGRLQGGQIEILTGLPQGLKVVASGGAFLNHGDAVRLADAPAPAR